MSTKILRIAAVGDLHCSRTSHGAFQSMFARISEVADMLLLAGDLTDYGRPEEAKILAHELLSLRVPSAAVLGNHDHESGQQDEIRRIIQDAGVTMLDGDACEILGVGIAGVKGFAGGFGPRALGPWGEDAIKLFVKEAVNEALKLEAALARLRTDLLLVLLHYTPIVQTAEGEPAEIYPFIGSSRLEEPIDRYPVSMVFHGHAHRGQPAGWTKNRVPVYNVSMPLLSRTNPDGPPFKIVEVSVAARPVSDRIPADR